MSYHLAKIPKGVLGQISKVEEEYQEFLDAKAQNCKIMMGLELSDMFGAALRYMCRYGVASPDLQKYLEIMFAEAKLLNLSAKDLFTMSRITSRAFDSGERVCKEKAGKD